MGDECSPLLVVRSVLYRTGFGFGPGSDSSSGPGSDQSDVRYPFASQRRGLMVETLDNQATEVIGESLHLCIAFIAKKSSLIVTVFRVDRDLPKAGALLTLWSNILPYRPLALIRMR